MSTYSVGALCRHAPGILQWRNRYSPSMLAHRQFRVLLLLGALFVPRSSGFAQNAQNQQRQPADELVRQFKAEQNPYFQVEVAKKLVALGDSSVLPELEPYLNNKERMVRGNAALVFAGLGDNRGFQTIVDILNDKSTNGREIQPSTINPVRQDRYFAAHLLGDLKDPRAVPILIPLLKDPDVNHIVPWSLGEIGDRSAIPALIAETRNRTPDLRFLAVRALTKLNAREALPRIEALLQENERIHFDRLVPVSQAAREAIALLREPPWPSVDGRPVATRVTTDAGEASNTGWYYGECQLKYVVNGKEYLLWTAAYSFFEESVARQKMSSCPIASFIVRYNPKDPADAVAMSPSY